MVKNLVSIPDAVFDESQDPTRWGLHCLVEFVETTCTPQFPKDRLYLILTSVVGD